MFISVVVGTRPQIIKSISVLSALEEANIDFELVHTGQHYDYSLSEVLIKEHKLPNPVKLDIDKGDPCFQTAEIMNSLCAHFRKIRPSYIIVPGDTTSALGAALSGFKMDIPVCHLESGLRIFDFRLQEELNRRLIDHGSSGLFAPTRNAVENLKREKVLGQIHHIGDTMYDVLRINLPEILNSSHQQETGSNILDGLDEYAVLTLHRREAVDSLEVWKQIISSLKKLDFQIIFPIHPRTKKRVQEFSLNLNFPNIRIVNPLPYKDFIALIANSKLVISDSGGIQKECYLLNIPMVTLRRKTEWVETIQAGANVLSNLTQNDIVMKCNRMFGKKLDNPPNVYGDGFAAKKIPSILESGEIEIPQTEHR